mgnify:CR=1 FL=1
MNYTSDIVDKFPEVEVLSIPFNDYGGKTVFEGTIETLKVNGDNALVRDTLSKKVKGSVLIVDGGASFKTALLGGNLAGLAAGLGLAALASYLGIGSELMGFLLILLAIAAIYFVVRFFLRSMQNNPSYEGVPSNLNREITSETIGLKTGAPSTILREASNEVSQDEIDNFLENSKKQFVEIQKIWDSGNVENLKNFCTEDLILQLSDQIKEKINEASKSSITQLNATWEGMDSYTNDDGTEYEEVYILFSGMIREQENGLTNQFSETWTLQRIKSTSDGWLIAGITQVN